MSTKKRKGRAPIALIFAFPTRKQADGFISNLDKRGFRMLRPTDNVVEVTNILEEPGGSEHATLWHIAHGYGATNLPEHVYEVMGGGGASHGGASFRSLHVGDVFQFPAHPKPGQQRSELFVKVGVRTYAPRHNEPAHGHPWNTYAHEIQIDTPVGHRGKVNASELASVLRALDETKKQDQHRGGGGGARGVATPRPRTERDHEPVHPGEIVDLDVFRERRVSVPLFYVKYLPYVGAPPNIDYYGGRKRSGERENVFESAADARHRFDEVKRSGWVEWVELREGKPGKGMMTSILSDWNEAEGGGGGGANMVGPEVPYYLTNNASWGRPGGGGGGARMTYAEKKAAPAKDFALPELRYGYIGDATHASNAMTRLVTSWRLRHLTRAQFVKAHDNIVRAEHRFGVGHHGGHGGPKDFHCAAGR
jgi:hypothetical protein